MNEQRSSQLEQLFDLFVDEVLKRLQTRGYQKDTLAQAGTSVPPEPRETQPASQEETEAKGQEPTPSQPESEIAPIPPMLTSASHAARMMSRLAWGLLIAVTLINIPFTRHGTTLATALPDTASYIIRDGFVVKEQDDQEIYVYQDGQFRWISSLDAFEHYGYTWEDVHIVADGYLDRYEIGTPIHVLLKCQASPHIYRLENGEKRWIRDIDTFLAEGHKWEDVRFVSCPYLRDLPDGEPIPTDAGPPPQP